VPPNNRRPSTDEAAEYLGVSLKVRKAVKDKKLRVSDREPTAPFPVNWSAPSVVEGADVVGLAEQAYILPLSVAP
jgi:hypothetical protein